MSQLVSPPDSPRDKEEKNIRCTPQVDESTPISDISLMYQKELEALLQNSQEKEYAQVIREFNENKRMERQSREIPETIVPVLSPSEIFPEYGERKVFFKKSIEEFKQQQLMKFKQRELERQKKQSGTRDPLHTNVAHSPASPSAQSRTSVHSTIDVDMPDSPSQQNRLEMLARPFERHTWKDTTPQTKFKWPPTTPLSAPSKDAYLQPSVRPSAPPIPVRIEYRHPTPMKHPLRSSSPRPSSPSRQLPSPMRTSPTRTENLATKAYRRFAKELLSPNSNTNKHAIANNSSGPGKDSFTLEANHKESINTFQINEINQSLLIQSDDSHTVENSKVDGVVTTLHVAVDNSESFDDCALYSAEPRNLPSFKEPTLLNDSMIAESSVWERLWLQGQVVWQRQEERLKSKFIKPEIVPPKISKGSQILIDKMMKASPTDGSSGKVEFGKRLSTLSLSMQSLVLNDVHKDMRIAGSESGDRRRSNSVSSGFGNSLPRFIDQGIDSRSGELPVSPVKPLWNCVRDANPSRSRAGLNSNSQPNGSPVQSSVGRSSRIRSSSVDRNFRKDPYVLYAPTASSNTIVNSGSVQRQFEPPSPTSPPPLKASDLQDIDATETGEVLSPQTREDSSSQIHTADDLTNEMFSGRDDLRRDLRRGSSPSDIRTRAGIMCTHIIVYMLLFLSTSLRLFSTYKN